MKVESTHSLVGPRDPRKFQLAQNGQIKLLSLEDKEGFLTVRLKQDVIHGLLYNESISEIRMGLTIEVKRLPALTSYIGIIFDFGNIHNPFIINELVSPLCGLQRNLKIPKGKLILCSLDAECKKALLSYAAGKDFTVAKNVNKAVEILKKS